MTTSKEADPTPQPSQECCMCGDFGLSSELFRCRFCQFRFQHRYCSNLYPKTEAYDLCNWCLSEKGESVEKTQNSLNPTSSNRSTSDHKEDVKMMNKKKNNGNHGGILLKKKNNEKGTSGKLHDIKNSSSIKKQRSPERSPPLLAARKRITTTTTTTKGSDAMEEKLMMRRTKSLEISNNSGNGIISRKPVFRKKVIRRYKLLDEVSSQ